MSGQAQEYPDNFLGLENVQSQHSGPVNKMSAPLKLDSGGIGGSNSTNGVLGAMLQSGAGVPTVGSPAGGFYFRTDGNSATKTNIYLCTVAGVAGAATWVGIA